MLPETSAATVADNAVVSSACSADTPVCPTTWEWTSQGCGKASHCHAGFHHSLQKEDFSSCAALLTFAMTSIASRCSVSGLFSQFGAILDCYILDKACMVTFR